MAKLIIKNVFLDPQVLGRAREILSTQSASETIREALKLMTLCQEVIQGFDQGAGKNPGFRDIWE